MLPTLVEAGADVNAQNDKGITALHMAAFRAHKVPTDTLIALKADVNIKDHRGLTPLVAALSRGHTDVAESLVAAGATAADGGLMVYELMRFVVTENKKTSFDLLMRAKADINQTYAYRRPHLITALFHKRVHIAKKLIAAGADTVTHWKNILNLCKVRKIDPAAIGIACDHDDVMPNAKLRVTMQQSASVAAPEEDATAMA
jgi:ankyrin repeat protein